jgi:gluconate:H+ symporter, GntP family
VVSLAVDIFAGMDIGSIALATVAGAGLVIALGAMLGKILAHSGVTETIADAILGRSSDKVLPWAMAFAAFVVGIPMFFEVGSCRPAPADLQRCAQIGEQGDGQRLALRHWPTGDRGS